MDASRPIPTPDDGDTATGFRAKPAWIPILLVLLFAQSWLTLRLFGPDRCVHQLLSDRPILSGRHPLHLYHGILGASHWLERGTPTCYDPAFQAGYPKTPVFDGSSRPAELFLLFGGGDEVAAYKLGFALSVSLLPLALVMVARGFGLAAGASCACGFFGFVLFWTPPMRALVDRGDLDLIIGGIAVLVHLAWLTRFSRAASPGNWLVMTLAGTVAWYMQPILSFAFTPMLLVWMLWIAGKQPLVWSASFVASGAIIVLVNLIWMWDWVRYSWISVPGTAPNSAVIDPEKILEVMRSTFPDDPLRGGLFGLGILGLAAMWKPHRAGAAFLVTTWFGLIVLASVSVDLAPLRELGAGHLRDMADWWFVVPAGCLVGRLARGMGRGLNSLPTGILATAIGIAAVLWSLDVPRGWYNQPPLEIGISERRAEILREIETRTTDRARILWEETDDPEGWTALLPRLTHRSYIGGLDPEAGIDHMYARLKDGRLAGRPLSEWSDEELRGFCKRYNVGWVICRTPASWERFRQFADCAPLVRFHDRRAGVMLEVRRTPDFFLKGSGRVVQMDRQRIALADITPDKGEVVLSLHHHHGWRISPGFVTLEKDIDISDPIPMMRLKLPGHISRLTLTWEHD